MPDPTPTPEAVSQPPKLLIRAEAGLTAGWGHVMRCLALVQAWQDQGGAALAAVAAPSPALQERLAAENCAVAHLACEVGSTDDAHQTAAVARQNQVEWVVVDGYHFGAEYQRRVRQAGLRLLVIDDFGHAQHYWADAVLNQNLSAAEGLYASREPATQLFLGPRYVLLRREFWSWRGVPHAIAPVGRKILVTLGGSDPDNLTLKIIHALPHLPPEGVEVTVVIGASNPHAAALKAASETSPAKIRLLSGVTDMPALMAWADVAIAAGGSTCWELAFMGLPALSLVLAENQRPVAQSLQAAGVVVNLGWHAALTPARIGAALASLRVAPETRSAMSNQGQALIDGYGAQRLLMRLGGERFWLRAVSASDCRLIWEWINDPETRQVSFSTEPIPWEAHVAWFEAKRQDPNCLYYLALDGQDEAIGQIRYECQGREAVISVEVAPPFRGQGYGTQLIRQASRRVLRHTQLESILAYVRPGNTASVRAFQTAGFRPSGQRAVRGQPALLFSLSREATS